MSYEPAKELVQFLYQLRYEDIPPNVKEVICKDVLDFLGNAIGGSSDQSVKTALALFQTIDHERTCSVLGSGEKLSCLNAAFLNAMMGFALDYDDTHERANTHLGVACIPAALAIAEYHGGIDGKAFITALAGAMEIGARLGIGCKRKVKNHIMGGWDYAALHGTFTAAAVSGKLLGLQETQLRNALGIAYQQASGNTLSAIEEADTKKMGPGFAARNGVLAALMAKQGLTGCVSVFSGTPYSLFPMYHDGGDPYAVTDKLGEEYVISELGFKSYPCCRLGHRYIDCVLNILQEHNLSPDAIKAIRLNVCPQVDIQLCQPLSAKCTPQSRNAAQFSLPWMLAAAVVDGSVGVSAFLPDALENDAMLNMAKKIQITRDDSLANETVATTVTIETVHGTFQKETGALYGNPENPMSREALKAKFLENLCHSVHPISEERTKGLLDRLEQLEALDDITCLLQS